MPFKGRMGMLKTYVSKGFLGLFSGVGDCCITAISNADLKAFYRVMEELYYVMDILSWH